MSQEKFSRYFVAGISRTMTGDDLRTHFSRFGNVIESRVHKDSNGLSLGYGWVGFDKPAPTVLQHIHKINGQTLDVQIPRNQTVAANVNKAVQPPLEIPQQRLQIPREKETQRKRSRSPVERRRSHSHRRRSSSRDHGRREAVSKAPPPPPSVPQPQADRFPQMSQSFAPPPPPPMAPAPPLGSIDAMTEVLVCIPLSLCPPQYARDPRVIIARWDATGALVPVSSSFAPPPRAPPQGPANGQFAQGPRPQYY